MVIPEAVKRWVAPLRPRLRPDLLLIGAQKAGTSALFEMLGGHPSFLLPQVKEPMFFNRDAEYARGMAHYFAGFPMRPVRNGRCHTVDASTGYLEHPEAPLRARHHLPEAQVIAVLRDPVSRAYSAWNMFRDFKDHPEHGHLHDPRSFAQAIADELEGRPVHKAHRYVERSHYAPQLMRWYSAFGRDRVTVFAYWELRADPGSVVERVLALVGERSEEMSPEVLMQRSNVRPYAGAMDQATRQRIEEHTSGWQRELEEVIGHPFPLQDPGRSDR